MLNLTSKWIVIEGPEGSGKTHAVYGLEKYFKHLGVPVITSREPGGVAVSERIREIVINDHMHAITEAYLFMASRAQHMQEVIIPALAEGKLVILDRFLHSTLAMQGTGRGLDVNELKRMHKMLLEGHYPDYVFFLDVPPDIGLARKDAQGEVAKFELEHMDFQNAVYEGYKKLTANREMIRIDATQSPEKVLEDIVEYIILHGEVYDE